MKSKRKLKNTLRQMKMKTTTQNLWDAAKVVLGSSDTGLPQETANISNKQSNFTPIGTRERRTNKT